MQAGGVITETGFSGRQRKAHAVALALAVAALCGLIALAINLTHGVATTAESFAREALRVSGEEARAGAAGGGAPTRASAEGEIASLQRKLSDEMGELIFILVATAAGNLLLLVYAYSRLRTRAPAHPRHHPTQAAARPGEHEFKLPFEDLNKLLFASPDPADAYNVIQRFASRVFAESNGALFVAETPGAQMTRGAAWGAELASHASFESADCWAVRRGGTYVVAKEGGVACRHMTAQLAGACACIPLQGPDGILGVLVLERQDEEALRAMLPRAESFAQQVGIALANMRQHEALHVLSVRDALTGLFNRRYMEESLQREIAAAKRRNRPLSVVLCDLNQFKRFNETHGREAGDYALRRIADLIVSQVRATDIACRYGKDEIVLIFPDAPLSGVVMRAKKLREAIYALQLEHLGKPLDRISASFGIAVFPEHGKTAAVLLEQAQQALARALEFGNDRVQAARPPDD